MAVAPVNKTTETRMGDGSVRFLVGYLLIATVLSLYLVYALWAAQPNVETSKAPEPACGAGASPALTDIYPTRVNVGSTGNIWLLGCGFTNTMQVKFDATQHAALFVDATHIRVGLTGTDAATPGTVVITLSNGATDVGSKDLSIVPAQVVWRPFGIGPSILSLEVQLLLMVLFTGAFGSCIFALKSVAD